MKPVTTALQTHLAGELTTLAYLVKITRVDGTITGFTTFDRDLTLDGLLYQADGAFTPSAVQSSSGLASDNLEITGILDSAILAPGDIEAGLYDHTRIDVYACNWADLTQGIIQLRRGWLGEVQVNDNSYVAELRGLHDLLQRPIGDYYTAECRYDLGDSNCTINIAAQTVTGSVTGVTDNATFYDTAQTGADTSFNYGKLTWTSGANAGTAMEVKNWDGINQIFALWLPMANPIAVGDGYSV